MCAVQEVSRTQWPPAHQNKQVVVVTSHGRTRKRQRLGKQQQQQHWQ